MLYIKPCNTCLSIILFKSWKFLKLGHEHTGFILLSLWLKTVTMLWAALEHITGKKREVSGQGPTNNWIPSPVDCEILNPVDNNYSSEQDEAYWSLLWSTEIQMLTELSEALETPCLLWLTQPFFLPEKEWLTESLMPYHFNTPSLSSSYTYKQPCECTWLT